MSYTCAIYDTFLFNHLYLYFVNFVRLINFLNFSKIDFSSLSEIYLFNGRYEYFELFLYDQKQSFEIFECVSFKNKGCGTHNSIQFAYDLLYNVT